MSKNHTFFISDTIFALKFELSSSFIIANFLRIISNKIYKLVRIYFAKHSLYNKSLKMNKNLTALLDSFNETGIRLVVSNFLNS